MENINENINGKQLRARFALGRLNINYHIINHLIINFFINYFTNLFINGHFFKLGL